MTTAQPQFSVGNSLTWAWDRFKDNAAALVVAALAWGAALVIIYLIASLIAFSIFNADSTAGVIFGSLIVTLITVAPIAYATAGFLNGAIPVVNGEKADLGRFFQAPRFVPVLIAMLLVAFFQYIGQVILSWVPGNFASTILSSIWSVLVGLAAMWVYYFAVDDEQDGFPAVQSTVALFGKYPGPSILVALVNFALTLVGALLCGIGLLVAIPLVVLFTLHSFRTLTGKPIAAGGPAYDAPGYPTAYPYGDPNPQYGTPAAPPAPTDYPTQQYGTPPPAPGYGNPAQQDPTQQYGTPPAAPGYGDPTRQFGTSPEQPGDEPDRPRG